MPKLMTTMAAAVALAVSLTALPASAASVQFDNAQVQNAQFSFGFSTGGGYNDRGFSRRGDYYYYNGYRGYRDRRAGFRFYNGFWFPNSAFSFGFTVGRDRDNWRGRDSMGNWDRHVAWCQDRYKSYRESDNTFQPYNGPRQECMSPYN